MQTEIVRPWVLNVVNWRELSPEMTGGTPRQLTVYDARQIPFLN
jgi:hypothetical protein